MSARVAPGCAWDLKTRAERREAVAAAVDTALDRREVPTSGVLTAGDGTVWTPLSTYPPGDVCQNTIRILRKNASTTA